MSVTKHFEKMGATAEMVEPPNRAAQLIGMSRLARARIRASVPRARVTLDGRGYRLVGGKDAEWLPLQVDIKDRHLLLLLKDGDEKHRFLCGHDERDWFVAAVPEPVSTIAAAKDSLKPPDVREADARTKSSKRQRRRNRNRIRQGEWFFIPEEPPIEPDVIHRNEPLMRPRSQPHIMQECFRFGGETVIVAGSREWTPDQWAALPREARRNINAVQRQRNPQVYVRGTVRHPDHATIHLSRWHRVLMNTERDAPGIETRMAFYD